MAVFAREVEHFQQVPSIRDEEGWELGCRINLKHVMNRNHVRRLFAATTRERDENRSILISASPIHLHKTRRRFRNLFLQAPLFVHKQKHGCLRAQFASAHILSFHKWSRRHKVINSVFFSSHLPLIPSLKRTPYLASPPTTSLTQSQRRHTLPERFLIPPWNA